MPAIQARRWIFSVDDFRISADGPPGQPLALMPAGTRLSVRNEVRLARPEKKMKLAASRSSRRRPALRYTM